MGLEIKRLLQKITLPFRNGKTDIGMTECKHELFVEFCLPWFQFASTEFRVVPVVVRMNPAESVGLLLVVTPFDEPRKNV